MGALVRYGDREQPHWPPKDTRVGILFALAIGGAIWYFASGQAEHEHSEWVDVGVQTKKQLKSRKALGVSPFAGQTVEATHRLQPVRDLSA